MRPASPRTRRASRHLCAAGTLSITVPEPASLALFAFTATPFLARRRTKHST